MHPLKGVSETIYNNNDNKKKCSPVQKTLSKCPDIKQ